MELDRRDFLKSAGFGAASLTASCWLGCTVPAQNNDSNRVRHKPNIVFIIVDDMGYYDLGCYGSKSIKTPNIDRMAVQGMRFTDAYSGATVCAPARSCLMTGCHMGHTSVRGNSGGIPLLDDDATAAEVLKKVGYVTGGFGKWGLGEVGTAGVPEKQGFDVFFGYYHQVHAHYYYTPYLWRNSKRVALPGNEGGKRTQYTHNEVFKETIRFIRENKDRPFFCYAPWTLPHGRYEFPEDDPAWQMYKDKSWPKDAKVVAAMDTMIDRHAGELLDVLKELGLDNKTIVFFCSDNGAARRFDGVHNSCGPMRGLKRSMYEGGIRVPMIAYWPGNIKPGTVSNLPWYFPDVMPTLAELAGASKYVPSGIDGISVVPTLLGPQAAGRNQEKHKFLFWEHRGIRAARTARWKAVLNTNKRDKQGQLELYDLNKDIGETTNLADKHTEIAAKMKSIIERAYVQPRPQVEPKKPAGKRYL